jgi:ribosome-associated toxin RatA of RatAB toxin-antitoxin module
MQTTILSTWLHMFGRGTRGLVWCTLGVGIAMPQAHASELRDLLKAGPLVRVEQTEAGRFQRVLSMADVDAPLDTVWQVLNAQERYKEFMPRIESLSVRAEAPNIKLVTYELDTPFVNTHYTLRFRSNPKLFTIDVEHVSGDIQGSRYAWKLTSQGPAQTRVSYDGVTRNFSSFVNRLEDDQQTMTVGLNVVTMLAGLKAVKLRAETLFRESRKAAETSALGTAPTEAEVAP